MSEQPAISVVISNYDYGRFLAAAIDSVLDQTLAGTEAVVVDDGSTDDSPAIIRSYGERVVPVLKANGGQASALNAGLEVARGRVVIFLDADDLLLPGAAGAAAGLLADERAVKAHWPLELIDGNGRPTGQLKPPTPLPEGDLGHLLESDCLDYLTPPQSGTAWRRSFLDRVRPLPELGFEGGGADTYLAMLALPYGEIRSSAEPLGCYRLHAASQYSARPLDERMAAGRARYERACDDLFEHCRRLGIAADPERWKQSSWFSRATNAIATIDELVPAGDPFILVDDGDLAMQSDPDRAAIPFLERDGVYWGPPPDGEAGIAEIERQRGAGVRTLIITWPCFWYLTRYPELARYLNGFAQRRFEDLLVAVDLSSPVERR